MGFPRIVVNADADKAFAKRAAYAAGVAARFHGQVTGVFARLPNPTTTNSMWPALPEGEVLDMLDAAHEQELNNLSASLKQQFDEAVKGTPSAWQELHSDRGRAMVHAAQAANLVVVSQPDEGDSQNHLDRDDVSEIVMRCGRPVLFHPYIDASADFKRILLAWDGSREAVRAVNDAAAFFDGADVLVLTANESADAEPIVDPALFVDMIQAHGATATFSQQGARSERVSDVIMTRAADFDADLVVMGGYSHSRFRELILGGATREILDQMPVPVLMSH